MGRDVRDRRWKLGASEEDGQLQEATAIAEEREEEQLDIKFLMNYLSFPIMPSSSTTNIHTTLTIFALI